MTLDDRNTILETVDILRTLGGQNGFSNLQPKLKRMLLKQANLLNGIVERDIRGIERVDDGEIETVYEDGSEEAFKVKI